MNINFQNKITIALIYIALIVINTFLGYLLFQSIYKKISFDKQKAVIYSTVIQRLKDIRKAQLAYKEVKSDYAGTFDELIAFIKSDSLRVVRKIGHLPDTLNEEIGIKSGFIITKLQPQQTPDDVIKMGKVLRDTVKIALLDTLFYKSYQVDSLRYIPYSNGEEFSIAKSEIETGSKVKVKVFEVVAKNYRMLKKLDKSYYLPDEELRIGSLTEITDNSGNWGE